MLRLGMMCQQTFHTACHTVAAQWRQQVWTKLYWSCEQELHAGHSTKQLCVLSTLSLLWTGQPIKVSDFKGPGHTFGSKIQCFVVSWSVILLESQKRAQHKRHLCMHAYYSPKIKTCMEACRCSWWWWSNLLGSCMLLFAMPHKSTVIFQWSTWNS